MKNKNFIEFPAKIEKNNPNQDINELKNLFSLKNYHYKDIINEEKNLVLIYRWPLLGTFNDIDKRG